MQACPGLCAPVDAAAGFWIEEEDVGAIEGEPDLAALGEAADLGKAQLHQRAVDLDVEEHGLAEVLGEDEAAGEAVVGEADAAGADADHDVAGDRGAGEAAGASRGRRRRRPRCGRGSGSSAGCR